MKRSLRSISLLLLVFTILTSLLSRSAIITFSFFLPQTPNHSRTNATILSISAHDASHSSTQTQVSDLLHASIESFNTIGAKYRTISLWHRLGFDHRRCLARIRLPISDRTGTYPPDRHVILPLFRHCLSKWVHYHNLNFSNSNSLILELTQLVKNPIGTYDTCAVVGNSGILLGSNHGELIDSHEFVIRLNNARIAGYERDVGSKTSLSFVNSNILHLCTKRDKCDCHPYGQTVPILMYICQPRHFLDYVVCNSSHIAPLLITDPRFDKLCARIAKYYSLKRFVDSTGQSPAHWNKKHDEATFHYSSGFQAVMLALRICKRVSIFGFGKITGAKHHYHTNQKAELALHDYEAEYMFYTDLIQRPQMIRLFAEIEVPNLVFYH